MGLREVVHLLRCPVCGRPLATRDRTLRCDSGHSFDIARHGYVTLLAGRARAKGLPGDTPDMVAAREAFLAAGHYRWLADAVAARAGGDVVVDAGAGTGYYLAAVLERTPGLGIAIDSSAHALRRAARAHPAIGAVRADLWRDLPLGDEVADVVLNVFAPRNAAEFRRVLRPGGRLVTVTPESRHLAELVSRLDLLTVDTEKERRLIGSLGRWFTVVDSERLDVSLRLDHDAVRALVAMGPSAWHTNPETVAAAIDRMPTPVTVTASCRVTTWRPS
jgi:23S rRNA (guanine745-N1)-methyltransferase